MFEAGIKYNPKSRRFEFLTSSIPANNGLFPKVYYGGSYTGAEHVAAWEKDDYLVRDAPTYPMVYKDPTGHFRLKTIQGFSTHLVPLEQSIFRKRVVNHFLYFCSFPNMSFLSTNIVIRKK